MMEVGFGRVASHPHPFFPLDLQLEGFQPAQHTLEAVVVFFTLAVAIFVAVMAGTGV